MRIRYAKMDGAGNRILVVDRRADALPPPGPERVRELGDERTGPGFDQMMWLGPARTDGAVASYRVFNRDGGEVGQCGNGVRCVAWLLAGDRAPGTVLRLDSPVGLIEARVTDGGQVSVAMGRPEFDPEKIPFVAENAANVYDLDVDGAVYAIGAVSMGNPHCVLEVPAVADAPVGELGPAIERHPRFPERTNVGFMARRGRGEIDLRVFERGVGETLACGTGACAAVAVGIRRGDLAPDVRVNLPGGQLVVSWPQVDGAAWLTGNAELMSEGSIDL